MRLLFSSELTEIMLCALHGINWVSKAHNCTLALLAGESEEVAQQTNLNFIVKGFLKYVKYLLKGILNLKLFVIILFFCFDWVW